MATSIWFVNGSSRGVGLEFVKQLSTGSKNRVIAGARKPADSVGLQHLKDSASNVTLVQLDQTDPDSIQVPLSMTRVSACTSESASHRPSAMDGACICHGFVSCLYSKLSERLDTSNLHHWPVLNPFHL